MQYVYFSLGKSARDINTPQLLLITSKTLAFLPTYLFKDFSNFILSLSFKLECYPPGCFIAQILLYRAQSVSTLEPYSSSQQNITWSYELVKISWGVYSLKVDSHLTIILIPKRATWLSDTRSGLGDILSFHVGETSRVCHFSLYTS